MIQGIEETINTTLSKFDWFPAKVVLCLKVSDEELKEGLSNRGFSFKEDACEFRKIYIRHQDLGKFLDAVNAELIDQSIPALVVV